MFRAQPPPPPPVEEPKKKQNKDALGVAALGLAAAVAVVGVGAALLRKKRGDKETKPAQSGPATPAKASADVPKIIQEDVAPSAARAVTDVQTKAKEVGKAAENAGANGIAAANKVADKIAEPVVVAVKAAVEPGGTATAPTGAVRKAEGVDSPVGRTNSMKRLGAKLKKTFSNKGDVEERVTAQRT